MKQLSVGENMRIRVVSSREEIFTLNPNERLVHLAFRPSNKDIFGLVETCPKIEVIQLPKSYRRTVSRSIEMFLQMQRVQLLEGDVWGHRKDINEYYNIPASAIKKIKEMKMEGRSTEEIEKRVSRESKLNPEMVNYILNKEMPA
ncbi:predicted protein [Methanosarcina acetivorans C2A]|uniref:Ribosomal protein S6 n=2 Tax=Methanosarcina acetivorans TaxID=2214 RepID=Q8TNA6_METAC|nr:predicted protein [Methanosarcina acetivorans C2A]